MDTYQLHFIKNLKHYRKKAGISQAKLAELCDVSNGTIGNIECGVTKPSSDLLILMSKALNIQPENFFQIKDSSCEIDFQPTTITPVQAKILEDNLIQAIQEILKRMKK